MTTSRTIVVTYHLVQGEPLVVPFEDDDDVLTLASIGDDIRMELAAGAVSVYTVEDVASESLSQTYSHTVIPSSSILYVEITDLPADAEHRRVVYRVDIERALRAHRG